VAWVKDALTVEGFLRQEWAGALGKGKEQFADVGKTLLVNALTIGMYNNDDAIQKATMAGDTKELTKQLALANSRDFFVETTVGAIIEGKPLDALAISKAIAGMVKIPGKTSKGVSDAMEDGNHALNFFKEADKAALMEIKGMTAPLADQIIAARATKGFTTLADVGLLPGFRQRVLIEGAKDSQKEIEKKKKEEAERQKAATAGTQTAAK